MIVFDDVTITYPARRRRRSRDVDLHHPRGRARARGRAAPAAGKTTLLRAINGLVPHFTGGTLAGGSPSDGRDTATHPPRELADLVGVVPQDPMSGFVTDMVEDELAYGMECLGRPGRRHAAMYGSPSLNPPTLESVRVSESGENIRSKGISPIADLGTSSTMC